MSGGLRGGLWAPAPSCGRCLSYAGNVTVGFRTSTPNGRSSITSYITVILRSHSSSNETMRFYLTHSKYLYSNEAWSRCIFKDLWEQSLWKLLTEWSHSAFKRSHPIRLHYIEDISPCVDTIRLDKDTLICLQSYSIYSIYKKTQILCFPGSDRV